MKEKYVVYEINEKELEEAIGGNDIFPHHQSVLCPECL